MTLANSNGPSDQLHVEFEFQEIIPDSVWTYTMCYKSEKYGEMVKDYRIIKPFGSEPSNFILDELNGIKMDLRYLNNSFYSFFEVNGLLLVSAMRLDGTSIYFEIFGGPSTPNTISRSTPDEDDPEGIEVKSFNTTFAQTVLLKRIK